MINIFDIANWFLNKESMPLQKLQKLCYYTQAWSYALMNEPLIDSEFEAWAIGPISRKLHDKYAGDGFNLLSPDAAEVSFTAETEEFLGSVWLTYGDHTGNSLMVLSQGEPPLIYARAGYDSLAECTNEIAHDDMRRYYRLIYSGDLDVEV
jgi:Uncharacterized phage-associated protein